LLVAQSAPDALHEDLSPEAVAELTAQSGRIAPDKLLSLIEQFANAEGRMKWAANKKMHFEIAAIRAIQTLGQATLTEVLDTLTAIRGGDSLPERPARKAEVPKASGPGPTGKKPEPAPAATPAAKPSLSAAVAASLGEKKAPEPAPKPTSKVSEEPVDRPESKPVPPPSPAISADAIWPQLVARVRKDRPLISEWLESGKLVEITNGIAVLAFPPDAGLAREACERANNRAFLEKVLGELAAAPLTIKTETREGLAVARIAREEARPEPKVDPMEAFKNDPLIQKALAEFKAEILPA
jgi:DNA polymerase-3 subunit gamma/tau